MLKSKKSKRKTIGVMTQSRGAMPPPARADEDKKRKNDRRQVKQKLRNGNYNLD